MDKESALFYVVLFLFAMTGIVTILGLVQKVSIERKYLNALFSALVLELIAAVLYMFSSTDFFDQHGAGEGELLVLRSELPTRHTNITESELIDLLQNHDAISLKLTKLEDEITALKNSLSSQNPPYDEVVTSLTDKINEIKALQAKQAQAEDYEQKYLKLEKQFLVRMANLNSKMSEWGTSINLRWKPNQKREIAKMLQEALQQIGFMDQNEQPNDNPEIAHRLLIEYQTAKNFGEVGFLTSEVIAFIIRDHLSPSRNGNADFAPK